MTAEVVRIYSPKYFGLPAERHGEYVIGVEKLPNMQDDITKLFEQHWEETETKYLDEPLRPDWDMLHFMSEQNRLLIFTARTAEGEMVGDIMYQLGHHAHMSGMLVSKEDNFFCLKAHRGSGLARALLDYAIRYHTHLGVKYMGMSDKSPVGGKSLEPFLESFGFRPNAIHYMKKL